MSMISSPIEWRSPAGRLCGASWALTPPESEGGLTVAAMHAVNGVPIVCAAALGLLGATEVTLGARTA